MLLCAVAEKKIVNSLHDSLRIDHSIRRWCNSAPASKRSLGSTTSVIC